MTRVRARRTKLPLILALDGNWADVKIWTERLRGQVWGCKIGSILFLERGPKLIESLQKKGFGIFLDLKFHDIPNTVQLATRRAFSWGVDLLTVHTCGGQTMMQAAAAEQRKNQKVVGVTVLTSLDQKDLSKIGVEKSVEEQVKSLGKLAIDSGLGGLVCSPKEVHALSQAHPGSIFITPGVRLASSQLNDQKRTDDFETTFRNGATFAVLGRALTAAENWEDEWQKITSSMEEISFARQSA